MNNNLNNMEDILINQIGGFHKLMLTPDTVVSFASQNLCEMLGVDKDSLVSKKEDLYIQKILPADREKYSDFIQNIISKEQKDTLEYRLQKADGSVIYVMDTITPKRVDDKRLFSAY